MLEREFYEDIENVLNDKNIPWDDLKNKCVFITGGTGLIGTAIIYALDNVNEQLHLNLKVLALVRNIHRAEERFNNIKSKGFLQYIEGNVETLPEINEKIDYIIHGASQTASKEFVSHAVETIQTSVMGTMNTLELAKKNPCLGYIYLSSMEVYGYPEKGHTVMENEIGTLSPLDLRNSYPLSKILAEAMCCAYAKEYSVPTRIIRLTQTYGPGISKEDTRIFAYIAKCVQNRQNIVLKTKGQTERAYLYTSDAVTAVLTILLKGKAGQAYNAADEDTYCSIAQMAEKIAKKNNIQVEYDIQDEAVNGYPKPLYMKLCTERLKNLGWKPMHKEDTETGMI